MYGMLITENSFQENLKIELVQKVQRPRDIIPRYK